MNNNIDLTKILKNCPKGTVFWSDDYGKVEFFCIDPSLQHPVKVIRADGICSSYTKEGQRNINFTASCLLWPSRDCRDWSKFTAHWLKKERFNPKTLKPFDRVLVRDSDIHMWKCNLFSHIIKNGSYPYQCGNVRYLFCIPYNDDTKHLVGTTEEAPEYYKYWED